MADETETENSLNQTEETSEQETQEETLEGPEIEDFDELFEEFSNEEQETSQEPVEDASALKEKNRQLFARLKKMEAQLKQLKGKKPAKKQEFDPLDIAKTVSVLKDYTPEELEYIKVIAKGKGIDPVEAVNLDEVKTYIEAKRAKERSEKQTPPPSTKQAVSTTDLEKVSPTEVKNLPEDKQLEWVNLQRKKAGKPPIPK